MPLALSPDGKGWVKVPPTRRRKPTPQDRQEAFKSPLAYFACTPVPAPKPRIPHHMPVYHLDPNEHTPPGSHASGRRGSHSHSHAQGSKGKGRSASTPHRHRHPYDDDYAIGEAEEEDTYHTTSTPARHHRPAAPRSNMSHERVRPRHTPGAVAAAMKAAGGTPPVKQRAATAGGTGTGTYWTGPSNKARAPPRSAAWGTGSSGGGSSAGGGASARWANATAPLVM